MGFSRNADLRSPRVLTVDDPWDDPPLPPPDGLSKGLRGQTLWMSRAPKGAERATDPHHMRQQFEIISNFLDLTAFI